MSSFLERGLLSILIERKWQNCVGLAHSMLLITTNYLSIQINEGFVLRFSFHQQTKVITSTIQHQVVRFNTSFDHVASARHTWIDWMSGSWTEPSGLEPPGSSLTRFEKQQLIYYSPWRAITSPLSLTLRFIQFHKELPTSKNKLPLFDVLQKFYQLTSEFLLTFFVKCLKSIIICQQQYVAATIWRTDWRKQQNSALILSLWLVPFY